MLNRVRPARAPKIGSCGCFRSGRRVRGSFSSRPGSVLIGSAHRFYQADAIIQRLHLCGGQVHIQRGHATLQLLDRIGADNWRGHPRLGQKPGK